MFYLHHISHFPGSGNYIFLSFHFTAISNGTGDTKGKKSILPKNKSGTKHIGMNETYSLGGGGKRRQTRNQFRNTRRPGAQKPPIYHLKGQIDKTARNREGRLFGNTGTGDNHHLFNSYRDVPSPDKKARQEGNRKKRGRRLHRCCSRGLGHGFLWERTIGRGKVGRKGLGIFRFSWLRVGECGSWVVSGKGFILGMGGFGPGMGDIMIIFHWHFLFPLLKGAQRGFFGAGILYYSLGSGMFVTRLTCFTSLLWIFTRLAFIRSFNFIIAPLRSRGIGA